MGCRIKRYSPKIRRINDSDTTRDPAMSPSIFDSKQLSDFNPLVHLNAAGLMLARNLAVFGVMAASTHRSEGMRRGGSYHQIGRTDEEPQQEPLD